MHDDLQAMDGFVAADAAANPAAEVSSVEPIRSPRNGGTIQSVLRAFQLLDIIAASGGEATLTDISRAAGLKVSTCHHLLATLIHAGYAAKRRGARTYVLGSKILALSTVCLKQVNLPQQAHRVIETLNARTKEAVQLAVLQGDDLITVMRKETLHAVRVDDGAVGKTGAAHATAAGKAILAWLPEGELRRIVDAKGLTAFTPHTISDFAQLVEELRLVRRRGFAIDREEFQPGVCGIGAAIRSPTGTVLGSISVSCPTFRADDAIVQAIQTQVIAAAQMLSADLAGGASSPDAAAATTFHQSA
jgi:IclR family transcriptional regulator, acetate operon repressor